MKISAPNKLPVNPVGIAYFSPGYILTARSLFFVEQRETHTEAFAAATMGALLVIGLIILIVIK